MYMRERIKRIVTSKDIEQTRIISQYDEDLIEILSDS